MLEQPVNIYYEIYDLSPDPDGETSVEIVNELILLKKKSGGLKKVFGFLGGNQKKSVSLLDRRSGTARDLAEHSTFDVSGLTPGLYQLKVTVKDLVSAQSLEKSIELQLVKR